MIVNLAGVLSIKSKIAEQVQRAKVTVPCTYMTSEVMDQNH